MIERINLGDFKRSICRTQQLAAGKVLGQEDAKAFVLTVWVALQHLPQRQGFPVLQSPECTLDTHLCAVEQQPSE